MASLATQLAVLATLEEPMPTSAVAEELAIEEVEVEAAVTSLEEAGLVEREGFGAKTRLIPVVPELPRRADAARSELSPDAWTALFVEERAELAYVLDHVARLELAATVLDAPVEAVRADVHDLAEAGIVTGGDGLHLDPGLPALAELLAEIDALRARRRVHRLDPAAEVRWHLGPEVLFTAGPGIRDPEVTYGGASLFADHGIELEPSSPVYCRTLRDLDASDAILQALLVAPDDDDEVQAACLELYEREPTPTFREKACIYGLEEEAAEFRGEVEAG